MQANIVVIEDDQDISTFLKEVLTEQGYQIYTAFTGTKGLEAIDKFSPELVLLDLKLPDIDGESVCRQIKKNDPEMKVIMITAKDTPEDLARGLGLGADDYIAKPIDVTELLARIKARLRTQAEENQMIEFEDLSMNLRTHEVIRNKQKIDLSAQEFKLLYFLMSNPNRVLTRDVILSRIWGMTADVETRVVDVYIGYLRKKIDADATHKFIRSVRGFGYMLKLPKEAKELPTK